MNRGLYSLLLTLLTPLYLLRLWLKGRKLPGYRQRWAERLGFFSPLAQKPRLWIHAVSVGEVNVAAPLIEHCLTRYPDHDLLVTTTTPTGAELVERRFGDRVTHRYFPYDLPWVSARFLRLTQPSLLLIMETELWPNLFHQCSTSGIPILICNARLSDKSLQGYRKVAALAAATVAETTRILVQTADDARRYLQLGAAPDKVEIAGNIKFDLQLSDHDRQQAAEIRQSLTSNHCWIAGSTHAGEEPLILDAHQRLLQQVPDATLILVPRHPERFDEVAALVTQRGLSLARRSDRHPVLPSQVYLADSLGELQALYGAADIAFVAGSLNGTGGHNPLEPAAFSLPVISGSQVHNFSDIFAGLNRADAVVFCDTAEALAATLQTLFRDPRQCQQRGAAALAYLQAHNGAAKRCEEALETLLPTLPRV